MFKLLFCVSFLLIFMITYPSMAQSSQEKGLPPLLDRQLFFGDAEISGGQLSPDGKYLTFIKPYKGTKNIWLKKVDAPFGEAVPITDDTKRPILSYFWSHDSQHVLYVQDKAGDENFHVYAVSPFERREPGPDNLIPKARDITPIDGIRAMIYNLPESDPDLIYVGLNDREAAWHDLYQISISSGERTLIRKNEQQLSGYIFDWNDQLRMATRTNDQGATELINLDKKKSDICYTCSVFETCYPIGFHKDGKRVYIGTNKGDDLDLVQLQLLEVATGNTTFVEKDPRSRVDLGGVKFSKLKKDIIYTFYNGDKPRYYFKDITFKEDMELISTQLEEVMVNFGSSTRDEQTWLLSASSDVDPGTVYLYDRKTRKLEKAYRPRPDFPTEHMSEMKPVRYRSLDGLEIPAYLTLPKGVAPKNLPAIIFVHGGPWARSSWGYNSFVQFFANRGYAVLDPNFRSSTGYGKAFLNAGNQEWGNAMQDDLTAGYNYLVEEGIANPDKVAIMGGSYGGYATLAGLAFTPDIYAAGVSIVGPSNLITLLESIPPYWESIRTVFNERMGDPTTEEGMEQLKRQSPLFSADKIKKPLLVGQGANDPRVKQAESDQIVFAMRELGLPVEYIVVPDEGHGFRRPINNFAFFAATEKFLAEHIGGRYQKEMTSEVAKRLEEITVDVETVEMPRLASEEEIKGELPKPVLPVEPATYFYQITIKMGPNELEATNERTVSEQADRWVIDEQISMPMGDAQDHYELQKGSLLPVKRELKQGPVTLEVDYMPEKVSGAAMVGGQEQPIEVGLEAPVYGDGGAIDLVLMSLPLEEGYTATYRTFDVQVQKVKTFELEVVGIEEVTVGAGTFEAFKVEITPLDGDANVQTNWISTAKPRMIVKSGGISKQMGGAKIEIELVRKE